MHVKFQQLLTNDRNVADHYWLKFFIHQNFRQELKEWQLLQTFGHPGLKTTPGFLREQSLYPIFGTTLNKKSPSCVAKE